MRSCHIVSYRGEWYLVAYCDSRREVVRFANARITRALVSEEHYSIPETFSINELMTSRFGIMTGEREHHVRVRFSAEQAPYVFKRTWHAGQKIRENGDGTVEIEF